jgi:hypothetical protein
VELIQHRTAAMKAAVAAMVDKNARPASGL